MKYIILLLFPFFVFANEQRILLSGITLHEHDHDRFDVAYNEVNYGLGYEYSFFKAYNELYFATNVLLLKDSFENPQLAIGMGHAYRFNMEKVDVAIGLSGFVGVKKIYTDADLNRNGGQYGLNGGVGPTTTVYYENLSFNFVYVPGIKYKDLDTTGFLYTYFGYRF
ncbi:MAG: Lipid A palmitoyltransferase PagP [uncultured Sulfurovum sp.]|uniref:Lipid A palmitoyltransferase PagP n=1 Tax=uncultured Sulfurovum sp. TaxID=269237 RepID=A0A6S6TGK2_9BACT|nr:MAG: Lipid A palmitoyltransferase PagP [uncultured Sulfurovum sp.]